MSIECVEIILEHKIFKRCYKKIAKLEKHRIFCRHDMNHFLDVARLMMILQLKEKWANQYNEEIIYATALLHDIGRHLQYKKGISHEIASAKIAPKILKDCNFSEQEQQLIIKAILNHRNSKICSEQNLSGLLYRADKMSRACFCCKAEPYCNWPDEKKNLQIKY